MGDTGGTSEREVTLQSVLKQKLDRYYNGPIFV